MTYDPKALAKPSAAERDRRYRAIRERMREEGLSALLVIGGEDKVEAGHLMYFTGVPLPASLVFPLEGEATLILDIFMSGHNWTASQSWIEKMVPGSRNAPVEMVKALNEAGVKEGKVGFVTAERFFRDELELNTALIAYFKTEMPKVEVVRATHIVTGLRRIKSAEEITFIERAAEISDMACEEMLRAARPGVTESELYSRMCGVMHRHGWSNSFLIIETGPTVFQAWGIPSQRKLGQGDIIVNEIMCVYGGYVAHPHKPASIGKPRSEFQDLYQVARAAYDEGAAAIGPGVKLADIQKVMMAPIEAAGLLSGHPLLHAGGLSVIEDPVLLWYRKPNLEEKLEAGMLVYVQPQVVTQDDRFGMHVGDTFIITETGARRLNQFSPDFHQI